MLPQVKEAIDVLERTPVSLRALVSGLGAEWTDAREGPETWSTFDVLGHLADDEEIDWMPRLRLIFATGETVPFTPYVRDGFRTSQQSRDFAARLDAFESLRREHLAELKAMNLTAEDLARTGMHPSLGRVTVEQLLAGWVVHDLTHVVQIARVLAKRYDASVGPWKAYLGVLNR